MNSPAHIKISTKKTMVKRLCAFVVVFVAVLAGTVFADVVWGNGFLNRNEDKAQRLKHHTFIVNSPKGYVIPQQEPGEAKDSVISRCSRDSKKKVKTILPKFENSDVLIMESVYIHKGKYWGVMRYRHGYDWPGWVPMDHLLMIYSTHWDFERENRGEFYEYTGSYDVVTSSEKVVVWQWPGSDREKKIIKNGVYAFTFSLNIDEHYRNLAYKDKEGREWVKTRYRIGEPRGQTFTGWVCISDPQNTNIPAFNPASPPVKWSPDHIRGR